MSFFDSYEGGRHKPKRGKKPTRRVDRFIWDEGDFKVERPSTCSQIAELPGETWEDIFANERRKIDEAPQRSIQDGQTDGDSQRSE